MYFYEMRTISRRHHSDQSWSLPFAWGSPITVLVLIAALVRLLVVNTAAIGSGHIALAHRFR